MLNPAFRQPVQTRQWGCVSQWYLEPSVWDLIKIRNTLRFWSRTPLTLTQLRYLCCLRRASFSGLYMTIRLTNLLRRFKMLMLTLNSRPFTKHGNFISERGFVSLLPDFAKACCLASKELNWTPSNANSLLWYPCENHVNLTPILPHTVEEIGPILVWSRRPVQLSDC